jgi:hypothetical protein
MGTKSKLTLGNASGTVYRSRCDRREYLLKYDSTQPLTIARKRSFGELGTKVEVLTTF